MPGDRAIETTDIMSLISNLAWEHRGQSAAWWPRAVLLCGLICLAGLMTGCSHIKQYSIDSYAGPLPTHDLRYTGVDP